MQYTPITQQQADAQAAQVKNVLLPKGNYAGVVQQAKEKRSSEGNDMIELVVDFEHPDNGRRVRVWDYLVPTDKAAWKLQHFAASAGIVAEYDAGTMGAQDCEGCIVRCEVRIEKGKDGNEDRNKIVDYLPKGGSAAPRSSSVEGFAPRRERVVVPADGDNSPIRDDEIPF